MATATGHQGHEALVFVAFAAEAVLGDAVGGELLVDGEAVRVVGLLVGGRVVDLNDLVALEPGAVEGLSDALPELGARLNGASSGASILGGVGVGVARVWAIHHRRSRRREGISTGQVISLLRCRRIIFTWGCTARGEKV